MNYNFPDKSIFSSLFASKEEILEFMKDYDTFLFPLQSIQKKDKDWFEQVLLAFVLLMKGDFEQKQIISYTGIKGSTLRDFKRLKFPKTTPEKIEACFKALTEQYEKEIKLNAHQNGKSTEKAFNLKDIDVRQLFIQCFEEMGYKIPKYIRRSR